MENKELLIEMYINGWITLEELEEKLEKLDNDNMPEPPIIYYTKIIRRSITDRLLYMWHIHY